MPIKAHLSIKGSITQTVRATLRRKRSRASSAIANAWQQAVMRSSISARAKHRYSKAIVPYHGMRVGATVRDRIAILLEEGWKPFDMKPGLLAGRFSRVVPLRIQGQTKFRTVSRNSPPSSWQHPGYRGAGVVPEVRAMVGRIVKEALKR